MTAESDLITRWRKTNEFYEALRVAAAVNGSISFSSKSIKQITDDYEAMLGGNQFRGVDADLFSTRAAIIAGLRNAKSTIQRHTFDYRDLVAAADMAGSTFDDLWPQLYRYYATNAFRVASRGMVFGAPSAGGSNAGDGAVVRCNVDEWGFTIEAQWADAKLLRCTDDATSGLNAGEEAFSIQSTTLVGRDALEESGSGKTGGPLLGISARNSIQFGLLNPSFSQSAPEGPTAAPTEITGWTSNITVNGTNYEVINDYYRGYFGDTTPMALRCKATAWILSQVLTNPRFDQDVPYYRHVAVRRKNSADGTLKFRLGRSEASVSLASLTNNVWYVLKCNDTTAWYKNFGEEGLTLEIERSGGTTGEVDIDDVSMDKFSAFDGGFYAIVGGPDLFQVEDSFTFTDAAVASAAGDSINQDWLWRALGLYLPSCPPAPAAAPTVALAGAGAGNVNDGAHTYLKVWVDVNGIESPIGPTVAITVVDKTVDGKVTVGRNEASPGAHIAFWRIYRSKIAGASPRYKLADVAIGTASYTDNTADASLSTTTAPAHTVSFLDPP